MNHFFRPARGFLLIELGVALALIGLLVTFISLFLAKGVETQSDVKMRLQALDVATTTVERLRLGLSVQKNCLPYTVTVQPADAGIDQKTIDALISRGDGAGASGADKKSVHACVVTVAWKSCDGKQKSVRLMTAFEADFAQGTV